MNDRNPSKAVTFGALAGALISVIAITLLGAAVSCLAVYVLLVWLGGFDLSVGNAIGIGMLWYIADISIKEYTRKTIKDHLP